MDYDPDLADQLALLRTEAFAGDVFRATRPSADPTAPSLSGGRWARPQNDDPGTSVLYTSLNRDGAIAEVVSFLIEQTPMPGRRPLKITRLSVTTSKTLRLAHADLSTLGIDAARYGQRDYARTQEIGGTLAWLGLDGLIAPSARWSCDNLIIFTDNHALSEKLDPTHEELIEWRTWAEDHGIIPPER
jgi:hypothetical protein